MSAVHRDPEVVALGRGVLEELRQLAPSTRYAALITDDGFDIAHTPAVGHDDDRFASMSSSVQALSEAVIRELAIGGSNGYVVIASDAGHVIQLRVPGQLLVLAALFDSHETLGKALASARRAAQQFGALLAARA